ncbi:MAG: hypothetical protein ABSE70_05560 [Candidatus Limnocylindrales bacterium]
MSRDLRLSVTPQSRPRALGPLPVRLWIALALASVVALAALATLVGEMASGR